MENKRILIVEDDDFLLQMYVTKLELENFKVFGSINGVQGLKTAQREKPDLILLDLNLPEMDGFEVLKELRKRNVRTPIIMLTAKSQEIDKILGLEFGADDYITKPFSPRELQARVKAVLRRVNEKPEISSESQFLFGDITVDFQKYECLKAGEIIQLTTLEFDLLKFLINHKGVVVSRDRIMDEVWGKEVFVAPRTVDTHILNLRKKIEDNPAQAKWIISVRGRGYKFLSS